MDIAMATKIIVGHLVATCEEVAMQYVYTTQNIIYMYMYTLC